MLRTQTYAGSDAGLGANSHLLIGEREVMLVDTQFLISEARKVVDAIKTTGERLTIIFVTHEHPGHHQPVALASRTRLGTAPRAAGKALPKAVPHQR